MLLSANRFLFSTFINICNCIIFYYSSSSEDAIHFFVDLSENIHLIIITAQVVFPVEVKDPGAPVDFYINGKKATKTHFIQSWKWKAA